MVKVVRNILINAPVEKVYDYLVDPNNLPEIWPSLVEIKDIQRSPSGEISSYKWTYKMAGMRFEGTTEITELVPNQRLIIKDSGGIQGTRTTTLQPVDEGTRLAVEQEYTVPVPLLGRLAEPFILKQNENEADVFLANLKARMES